MRIVNFLWGHVHIVWVLGVWCVAFEPVGRGKGHMILVDRWKDVVVGALSEFRWCSQTLELYLLFVEDFHFEQLLWRNMISLGLDLLGLAADWIAQRSLHLLINIWLIILSTLFDLNSLRLNHLPTLLLLDLLDFLDFLLFLFCLPLLPRLKHCLKLNHNLPLLFLSEFFRLWLFHASLIFSDQGVIPVFNSVFSSRVIHHLHNFTPGFWLLQDIVEQNQILFKTEFDSLFWLVQVVVPSLTARFRCAEYSPFSLEKYYLGHVIPVIENLWLIHVVLQALYCILQEFIFFTWPCSFCFCYFW